MEVIKLAHGNGGRLMHQLIEDIIYERFGNDILLTRGDAACLPQLENRLAVATDSFVVNPLFFPGGDIGKLAVCGTVNDLAVQGAEPLYLTVSFILEAGLPVAEFKRVVNSLAETADKAGIKIVTGDTKVVEDGQVDKMYINTTGVGRIKPETKLAEREIEAGDKIIVNGSLGNHGAAILAYREGFDLSSQLNSDCRLLDKLTAEILAASNQVKLLTDPTRGGLVTALNEIANHKQVSISLKEAAIPINQIVASLGEILGIDPLYLANEGRIIAVVGADDTAQVATAIQQAAADYEPQVIGEISQVGEAEVVLETSLGGTRVLRMLTDQLLPRIC